jgi:hypothetical protein
MAERRLVLRSPQIGWGLATGTVLTVILVAALVTASRRDIPQAAAVEQPLHFANGALVPGGRWAVLCIDGVAYLEIVSPSGQAIVPKHRRNGLIERCATTGRE